MSKDETHIGRITQNYTTTKSTLKSAINNHIAEMIDNVETVEQTTGNGCPLASSWKASKKSEPCVLQIRKTPP